MRYALGTLLVAVLFSTPCLVGTCPAFVTTSLAQEEKPPAPFVRDLKPQGPDELFTPLPDVTFEGKVPTECRKVVVLHVPNRDSWNDSPALDLSGSERIVAGGFELTLGQQLEYRPYFHLEPNEDRVRRYLGMLRNAEVPRVGANEVTGKKFPAVEQALDTFAADTAFLLSYVPGAKDAPARGAAFRYQRDGGVLAAVAWEFPKLGKPDADSTVRFLEEKVVSVLGRNGQAAADGAWAEYPFAPVPRLCVSDAALRDYVTMRDAFYGGELSKALINYESLMAKDPACGRAALFGMEIYRAVSETQTDMAENTRYRETAVKIGREALKYVPNDVLLRGHLSWLAATHYNRFDFGQTGLKQAMRVQPANVELFGWWLGAYSVEDRAKQVEWLVENALPLVKDGRVEYVIATSYYANGEFARGVEWYRKAVALSPLEHEWQKSMGMCATYLAESSFRNLQRDVALDAWITGTAALAACQEIDQQEDEWVYEYYVRVATHNYSHLPSGEVELERLFLSQAVVNGLEPNSRTFQWDRLVKDITTVMGRNLRETCKAAKPGDDLYEVKLMARLQFARVDEDTDGIVHTLWIMRSHGMRPYLYTDMMRTFGPVVKEYEPKKEERKPD